ncbi:uncharacterized protein MONOS_5810 [Monocercomonoides exilis]|uniref:uncharacterized protein n=1 Tax=Monocercomonoides exilis TaxID=2049356 RepID=UPI00355AACE9|nr:hypothetical protein MONOS_5810 [Monocercomonoides exilis]|eukprot:MONOS_5810.2-p1 / transcript=MONOS_5810.2 / gene=MONOS_5810 / organism=Monocercomonoides_exilis_PA203 / gene_product=unspecified product / transcript_product=unspecified product / location=Mono_scaffold00174:61764-63080(-) / protein_length=247 / sequence_SO=supercontig / SO=protein_coding / is_pseudo=false
MGNQVEGQSEAGLSSPSVVPDEKIQKKPGGFVIENVNEFGIFLLAMIKQEEEERQAKSAVDEKGERGTSGSFSQTETTNPVQNDQKAHAPILTFEPMKALVPALEPFWKQNVVSLGHMDSSLALSWVKSVEEQRRMGTAQAEATQSKIITSMRHAGGMCAEVHEATANCKKDIESLSSLLQSIQQLKIHLNALTLKFSDLQENLMQLQTIMPERLKPPTFTPFSDYKKLIQAEEDRLQQRTYRPIR